MANVHDLKHWRYRAEEARSIAEGMIDPETRRIMNGIAAEMNGIASDYERLAKRAKKRIAKERAATSN